MDARIDVDEPHGAALTGGDLCAALDGTGSLRVRGACARHEPRHPSDERRGSEKPDDADRSGRDRQRERGRQGGEQQRRDRTPGIRQRPPRAEEGRRVFLRRDVGAEGEEDAARQAVADAQLRDALGRVGDVGSGVLTDELRAAVLASGTGSNLSDALLALAKNADVPALSRAIEHLVAAMDRGAPLAQVLQEQAGDAREDAKRALIEAAGRKEILMLLPRQI